MRKTKNKFILKSFFLACLLVFSFSIVSSVFAQALVPCGIGLGKADCTLCHLVIGFKNIYDYLLYVVLFPATVLVIVIAGIMYMVSSGNKGLIEKAKTAFTYALAALVLALTAWLLINATLHALGYKNVGNWWTYTCDTTQSKDAGTLGPGGSTLPGSGSQSGAGGVLGNTIYEYGQKYYDSNGVLHTDCSGYAEERRIAAGLGDPGRDTATQMANATAFDQGQLREGSLIFSSSSQSPSGRHVAVYNGDRTVSHNSGSGVNVVTVPLDQYLSSRNITGMLI